jgi:rfaE bifunctional protein kinase chain/domain
MIPALFDTFRTTRVLVVGDVMMDAYVWGKVSRISPEAPVPVVHIQKREERLGGAANVALNLVALGAQVSVAGVAGNDHAGQRLLALLKEQGMDAGCMITGQRPTTVKTRIISGSQQMLRIDDEHDGDISAAEEDALIHGVLQRMNEGIDLVVLEDYNKGVFTPRVIRAITEAAAQKGIISVVDPKFRHFLEYRNVTLFKPNLKELREGLGMRVDPHSMEDLIAAADRLFEALNCGNIMITLSEAGVFVRDHREAKRIPAHVRNIADVSGAGDTVISVVGLCLAAGLPLAEAAGLANLAGGLVCEKVGVVPVDRDQLLMEALNLKD